ncbi:sensor histidine kinase [uncultured Acetobacteroides sp.]|uniref:sensor histidine kinase n=1 Tax=uncultured Acetobacteroides sp. TaxID=1760811 RepID=UPI0037485E65
MKLALKILIHGIFWTVFGAFSVVLAMLYSSIADFDGITLLIPHLALNFIWAAVIFYLFYGYFIRYFEQRQLVRYLIYSLILTVLVSFVFLVAHWVIAPHFKVQRFSVFGLPVVGTFIIAQSGSLVRGFENWFTNIKVKAELENRNLKNELEVLKSQINPHFLFNTLNNIDSFIHSAPDEASKALITLSDMMRYMVYETRPEKVPLTKEVEYVQNYIRLQQIRFKKPEYVKYSFPCDCSSYELAPMLFIPFVENAFKYSANKGIVPVIDISLQCDGKQLHFVCRNYFNDEVSQHERSGGVGLENVKRRLALLYPGKYQLHVSKENHIFSVDLSILLS